jgi:insertion element IS1 protein InsB
VRYGRQAKGEQRYRGNKAACERRIFLLQYHNTGRLPGEWPSRYGPRARSQPDDSDEHARKKAPALHQVTLALASGGEVAAPTMVVRKVRAAELDEVWSFVGGKKQPRWLWGALEHQSGRILAYDFGRREDRALLQLKALLVPFGITRFYTDGWGAYRRHLAPDQPVVGKRRTQRLERNHLTLRIRIKRFVRKTICFSTSIQMHDTVIGLFINRFEFGLAV